MNDIQQKVWDYLTTGGSRPERLAALQHLTVNAFFNPNYLESVSRKRIEEFIKANPTNACAKGVRRFSQAVGVTSEKKVVVTFEAPLTALDGLKRELGGSVDGGAVWAIMNDISGRTFGNVELGRARFINYNVVDRT